MFLHFICCCEAMSDATPGAGPVQPSASSFTALQTTHLAGTCSDAHLFSPPSHAMRDNIPISDHPPPACAQQPGATITLPPPPPPPPHPPCEDRCVTTLCGAQSLSHHQSRPPTCLHDNFSHQERSQSASPSWPKPCWARRAGAARVPR